MASHKLKFLSVKDLQGNEYRAVRVGDFYAAGMLFHSPEEIASVVQQQPLLLEGSDENDWLIIPVIGRRAYVMYAQAFSLLEPYGQGYYRCSEPCGNPGKTANDSPADDQAMADFSAALSWLKDGKRAARAGWNGKGQFVVLIPGANLDRSAAVGLGADIENLSFDDVLALKNAGGDLVCGWVPSTGDLMADDWVLIP